MRARHRGVQRFQISGLEVSLGAQRWARLGADLDAVIALEESAPPVAKRAKPRR